MQKGTPLVVTRKSGQQLVIGDGEVLVTPQFTDDAESVELRIEASPELEAQILAANPDARVATGVKAA